MTPAASGPVVVVLGDRGRGTRVVFHALAAALGPDVEVRAVLEQSPSRVTLARRRARRLGWPTVAGQVAFVALVMPILSWRGRGRVSQIAAEYHFDPSPIAGAVHVDSVNDDRTTAAVLEAAPALVVVHGTRVIAERVLRRIEVPVMNVHAGVTPRYRGVHGGYWAYAEGHAELAGTTVHLVDAGIDTGGILGQATFERRESDSIATYPFLHLACGIPLLVDQARRVLGGSSPQVCPPLPGAEVSQLRWHPTIWGYVAARVRRGVR